MDAVVIGAGVVGVTAALALQQRGLRVLLLEQHSVAQGCSFGNAGVIAPGAFPLGAYYRVLDFPAAFLKKRSPAALHWPSTPGLLRWGIQYAKATRRDIVSRHTRLLHELCREALYSYELLLGADLPTVNRCGYSAVHLAPDECECATRINLIRRSLGLAVQMLSGPDLIEMEPAIGHFAVGATFFEGSTHVIDPATFVASLATVFIQRGGLLRCDRILGLQTKENGVVTVRGAHDNYSPKAVIIATGAHANRLLADCNHRVPLASERGYHLDLDVSPGFLRRPTALPGRGLILTPTRQGARIAGISHFGLPGFQARPELLLSALDSLHKRMPMLRPRPGSQVWSGERPSTPDSLPIVEQVPGHRSIFVSCGHGHLGLTLGAVTARVVADLVMGHSSSYLKYLSSLRFKLKSRASSENLNTRTLCHGKTMRIRINEPSKTA
ncbi:NAD(P)/FAD-dependent oxidoreductase [Bradyrhizobium sp. CCBAU 11434]|uniref:NAD(P)/FAD-dependent oxidoreductase n=1 Tax=Bradyrhizobium sp. CCBAU 11434 TaxID=1630885 RepID=UPI0023066075|nr:FAD-dependent oxidoreductase [Bradyrhizobium sp. CCBAU 11434]